MLKIIFKNKETNTTFESLGDEYMCLTHEGKIYHWKKSYGQEWYFVDVSDLWIALEDNEKVVCKVCNGDKMIESVVSHDDSGSRIWGNTICWCCDGSGKVNDKG